MDKHDYEAMRRMVYQVEQTGKRWKGYQLLGGVGEVAGIGIAVLGGIGGGGVKALGIGAAVFVLGAVMDVIGRIGAWWYHG